MKAYLKKSLELLDKYLKETPKNIIEKELSFYDNLDFEGPPFSGYIESFSIFCHRGVIVFPFMSFLLNIYSYN